jgi:hypothetical protein
MSYSDYVRIHKTLSSLKKYKDAGNRNNCPPKEIPLLGVYVHYEDGEFYQDHNGYRYPRIVRIGTGVAKTGLMSRLRWHCRFRSLKNLSSFQGQVERALDGWSRLPTDESERLMKLKAHMLEHFSFSVIGCRSKERALRVEKGLIANLAPYSYHFASKENWLGFFEESEGVSNPYGLWNKQQPSKNALRHEFSDTELENFLNNVSLKSNDV